MRRTISVLAALAIVAAMLVAMAMPAFAAPDRPKFANGRPDADSNAVNQGTINAFLKDTSGNQPCSIACGRLPSK